MSQSPLFNFNQRESVFDNLLSMERRAEAAEAHRDALLAAAIAIVKRHDADARACNHARCGCQVCVALRPAIAKCEAK